MCNKIWLLKARKRLLFSRSVMSNSLQPMDCSTPGFPVSHHLLELLQTHVHWVDEDIQTSHPLLLLLLPSIFPSIRVFFNASALHIRWPKYWSFSFSVGPSNEYSWIISFKIDWFDFLAVQGILKSLLQHHSSKASILWYSVFVFCFFFCFLWSNSHLHIWLLEKPQLWLDGPLSAK